MLLLQKWNIFYQTITEHKRLFFTGLIIKLIFGSFLASSYLTELFAPFINNAFSNNYFNCYDDAIGLGKINAFPYPSMMLFVLSIFKAPFAFFTSPQIGFIDLISIRLALLVADAVILFILLQWLKNNKKQVFIFYWLSPITIYINYVHGQLDAIPIAFLLLSLYFLFKNKQIISIVLLAIAVGCKTNILLAAPFIFIYLYKNNLTTKVIFLQYLIIFIASILLINLPFINSAGYLQMVYQNQEQAKVFNTSLSIIGGQQFLIVPALYVFLIIRFSGYWQMSKSLILMYLGFAFGIFTIFIAANQGWYYWSIPFFIYFLIKERRYTLFPFIAINIFYFLHFAFIEKSDFISVWQLVNDKTKLQTISSLIGLNIAQINWLFSSALQASIIGFCYFLYRVGLSQIKHFKMLYQPYLIGISGNSASGKTTLANLMQQLFNKQNCTVLNGDDMHKWERNNPNYKEFTHLHPKANNLYTQLQHFLAIGKGNTIERSHYNHDTGTFTKTATTKSSKIVIFEGLHTLFFKQKKQWFDLTIYLKPEEDLRVAWKLERDVNERGHDSEKVLSSINERKADEKQYIHIQEQYADVVISFINQTTISINTSNIYNLEPLINILNENEIVIAHQFMDDRQILDLNTNANIAAIKTAAADINHQLEELGISNINWQSNQNGLLQVVLCHIIFNNLNIATALNSPTI